VKYEKRHVVPASAGDGWYPAQAVDDPNRVTIPTAASIVGVALFFSDVRVFKTSYHAAITTAAVYRCFIGACPSQAPQIDIVLSPRESKAFNDMVGAAFDRVLTQRDF